MWHNTEFESSDDSARRRTDKRHTRHHISSRERKAIRDKARKCPQWTQTALARWATSEFGRPIRQSTVSDSLQSRFAYVDVLTEQPGQEKEIVIEAQELVPTVEYKFEHDSIDTLRSKYSRSKPKPADTRDTTEEKQSEDDTSRRSTPEVFPLLLVGPLSQRTVKVNPNFFPRLVEIFQANAVQHEAYASLDKMGNWLAMIKPRVDSMDLLNDAMQSLSLCHYGISTQDDGAAQSGVATYGRAIKKLKSIVDNPSRQVSHDLISAIFVLSVYEMHACTNMDGALNHTYGASKMMEMLGPDYFTEDDYGKAILLAFRGQMVYEALFRGRNTFLNKKSWRAAIDKASGGAEAAPMERLTNEFFKIEGILCAMVHQCTTIPEPHSEKVTVLKRLFNLRNRFHQWYTHYQMLFSEPTLVPMPNDPVFPMRYRYSSICAVMLNTNYLGCLILLNLLIARIQPNMASHFHSENLRSADEVLKSAIYAREERYMGPYEVCLGLKMAQQVVSEDKQVWIRDYFRSCDGVFLPDQPGANDDDVSDKSVHAASPASASGLAGKTIKEFGGDVDMKMEAFRGAPSLFQRVAADSRRCFGGLIAQTYGYPGTRLVRNQMGHLEIRHGMTRFAGAFEVWG